MNTEVNASNSLIQEFDIQLGEPGQVWVEYYPKGKPSKALKTKPIKTLSTEPHLQVMRLTADTKYCYQVYARANTGSEPETNAFPGGFTTGPLPANLADSTFKKTVGTQTYDLTLLDFNDSNFAGLVALNEDAEVVWYYQHPFSVFAAAQKEDFNLVLGQINGRKHVEIAPDGTLARQVTDVQDDGTPCAPAGRWHHESLIQPGDKVLFMGSEIRDVNIDGVIKQQTGDAIMEWDQNQNKVSTLVSLFDLLDPAVDRTLASNTTSGPDAFFWHGCHEQVPSEDWTHANSIWVAEDGTFIVSCVA